MTNQELQLASVREVTGTAYGWPGDWHALFDLAGIPQGDFNGRLLAWINDYLGTSYAGLPQAMQAFAVDQGYINWSSMGTFDASGSVVYDFSGASLPAGATLERASAGTRFNSSGLLVSEAIDAARFDYNPATLALRGLLVEPQRTNSIIRSSEIAGGSWSSVGTGTLATSGATAPDGSTNAVEIADGSGTGFFWRQSTTFAATNGQPMRASIFVKSAVMSKCVPFFATGSTGKGVNMATGALYDSDSIGIAPIAEIEDVGSGWYRVTIGATAAGNNQLALAVVSAGGGMYHAADGSSFLAWGADGGQLAAIDSYIPTSGSSATRSVDVLTLDLDDGDWNLEVVTPNGTFTTPSPVTSSGGYVFDWADLTGAATERHVLSITATGA